jgi:hypothetical protein
VTIRLKTENLLYDIAQAGFLSSEAVALRLQDNPHVKHRMKDIAEDGNVDIVVRELDNAYTHSLLQLSHFAPPSPREEEITMTDDYDDYRDSYDYTLYINHEHARFLAERLTSLLHDYLVSSAICRYISVVADTSHSSEIYKQREEDTIGEIIAMLSMYDCERPITATM